MVSAGLGVGFVPALGFAFPSAAAVVGRSAGGAPLRSSQRARLSMIYTVPPYGLPRREHLHNLLARRARALGPAKEPQT
jgi:hypothetical protein